MAEWLEDNFSDTIVIRKEQVDGHETTLLYPKEEPDGTKEVFFHQRIL